MNRPQDETVRAFYAAQSAITDPGNYVSLFATLPRDLPGMIKTVQGLLVWPYGKWARHHVKGDMAAVDRAWNLIFKSWLPAAVLELRNEPAEEIYRRVPRNVATAKRFDLWCCLPVE